jgi:hypothetical protein
MKKLFFFILIAFAANTLSSQKYFTKTGKINFESKTKIERIAGENNKATSVYDSQSGALEYSVLIKAFGFEKALMQEHFNENYMESTKFPKATFKGTVLKPSAINLSKDGTYTADIKGKLTMHGQTKEVVSKATFLVKGGKISANSVFKVLLADYKIDIPSVVKDNISKEVTISIETNYELLTK